MNKITFIKDAFEYRYELPKGWWNLYQQFCIDLYKALELSDAFEGFKILQVKEKYGKLTFYSKGATRLAEDVITKYTFLSEQVCCICGKPATAITYGHVCPYCTEHLKNSTAVIEDCEIIYPSTLFKQRAWSKETGDTIREIDCSNEWYRYLERIGELNEVGEL